MLARVAWTTSGSVQARQRADRVEPRGLGQHGHMTVGLLRQLIEAHPNLYLRLKILDSPGPCQVVENVPLERVDGPGGGTWGAIRSEWYDLIVDHPDRFVLGGDELFGTDSGATTGAPTTRGTWSLLGQLPEATARTIACENPRRLYGLQ